MKIFSNFVLIFCIISVTILLILDISCFVTGNHEQHSKIYMFKKHT